MQEILNTLEIKLLLRGCLLEVNGPDYNMGYSLALEMAQQGEEPTTCGGCGHPLDDFGRCWDCGWQA